MRKELKDKEESICLRIGESSEFTNRKLHMRYVGFGIHVLDRWWLLGKCELADEIND